MKSLPIYSRVVVFVALFLISPITWASSFDPNLNWKTTESEHFIYHYDEGLRFHIQQLIPKAEQTHTHLSKWFDWRPLEKTHVILVDPTDGTNGFASYYPSNVITLFMSPPHEPFGLEDFDDWLGLIFVHEYTHTLHMDMGEGLPKHLRWLLGRHFLLFPNVFIPRWMLEGLATYIETDYENHIGRGTSSYFKALMRNEMRNGLLAAGDVSQVTESWPGLTRWYLYGVYWFKFLEDKYGQEKIIEVLKTQSGFPVPYLPDVAVWMTFDKTIIGLWDEFEVYLKKQFAEKIRQQDQAQWQVGNPLTSGGPFHTHPQFISDTEILFLYVDGKKPQSLAKLNIMTGHIERISRVYGQRFDFHPKAGIVMAQNEFSGQNKFYHDLYLIDPVTGEQQRISQAGRYLFASWHPEGKKMVAVKLHNGVHTLHELDTTGKILNEIDTQGESIINSVQYSADGQRLLLSIWREELLWHLEEVDLKTQQWTRLTDNTDIEMYASYDAQGDIVYSADYDGVYNIYRLQRTSGKVEQLTSVQGAAFQAVVRNENLLYSGMAAGGFDLHLSKDIQSRPTSRTTQRLPWTPKPTTTTKTSQISETDYFAPKYLWPKWWLPSYQYNNGEHVVGINTSGNDFLQWHNYALNLRFDFSKQRGYGSAAYTYNRWEERYSLVGSRQIQATEIVDNLELSISRPWPMARRFIQVFGGYQLRLVEEQNSDRIVGIGASYSNLKRQVYSVTSNSGLSSNVKFEFINDSDTEKTHYSAFLNLNLATPSWHRNIIGLYTLTGINTNPDDPYELYSANSISFGGTPLRFGIRSYQLRGYNAELRQGRDGNVVQLASLQWHFPIADSEFGWVLPPLGLIDIQGNVFAEVGRAWHDTISQENLDTVAQTWIDPNGTHTFSRSIGAELEFELSALYRNVCSYRIGIARGFDVGGEDQIYFGLSCY